MAVTNFVWDELSDNVRMEVDDTGAVTAEYMNEPSQFGNLLSQRRGGINSFYHFDAQGSTRQMTNDAEAVTDAYTYTAFGEPVTSSGSTTNPFRYYGTWGYYSDEETGEVNVRRRIYDSSLGRWLSADPLGFVDGPNVYLAYFVPDGTDPSGTDLLTPGACPQWPLRGTTYGCYCGPGNPPQGVVPAGPIDSMDNCCKAHDVCYGDNGCPRRTPGDPYLNPACRCCDEVFCRCLKLSICHRHPDDRKADPNLRNCISYRNLAMGIFECEGNHGIPNSREIIPRIKANRNDAEK